MKTLSIIVLPGEDDIYFSRCIDSICYDDRIMNFLDILIVNNKEESRFGLSFGSAIRKATGKYCCVVLQKDFFDIDYFSKYVHYLKNEESDLVLLRYIEENIFDKTSTIKDDFSFQAITVRTSIIRNIGIESLKEFPFAVKQNAKTVSRYDFNIYRDFYIPSENRYMKIFKRNDYYENLIKVIIDKYPGIFQRKKVELADDYYRSYFVQSRLSKKEKERLLDFDVFLKEKYPILHKSIPASRMLRLRLSSFYRNIFIGHIGKLWRNK